MGKTVFILRRDPDVQMTIIEVVGDIFRSGSISTIQEVAHITVASTSAFQGGQSLYVWQKMPPLTTTLLHFDADISHLNYQQTKQNWFETKVHVRIGHAPDHHDHNIRISKWLLAMPHS